jgi:hypothetical protein
MSARERINLAAESYAATATGRENLPAILERLEGLRGRVGELALAFREGDALWLALERASIELAELDEALYEAHEAARA